MDEATFLARVAQAQEFIRDGEAYQLQVGIRFSCVIAGTAFDFYRHIRARNPSPYMFFLEAGGRAVFGASPEFLVRLDGSTARIRPLAGTRPRGADEAADHRIAAELLADPKERAEHVMLVDLARNDLGAVCRIGSVHVDELMVIERYSHVMHIVSNVVGELRPGVRRARSVRGLVPGRYGDGRAEDPRDAADRRTRTSGARPLCGQRRAHRFRRRHGLVHHPALGSSCQRARILASLGRDRGDSVPMAEYAEVLAKTGIVRAVLGIVP